MHRMWQCFVVSGKTDNKLAELIINESHRYFRGFTKDEFIRGTTHKAIN